MKLFFEWLFATPTPLVAVISAIIAYLAYNHQRKLNKKNRALTIAEMYAEKVIPRLRYVASLLGAIECEVYTAEFNSPKDFTEQELTEFLKKKNINIEDFKSLFKNIKKEDLEKAYIQSGCNSYISECHKCLIYSTQINNEGIGDAIYKFILDLLNDIEAFSSQFYYNIAEEELVYPILHQTFLSHIKNLYFFIAERNRFDQDRYYLFTIWLYDRWVIRKEKQSNKLKGLMMKNEGKKRLH